MEVAEEEIFDIYEDVDLDEPDQKGDEDAYDDFLYNIESKKEAEEETPKEAKEAKNVLSISKEMIETIMNDMEKRSQRFAKSDENAEEEFSNYETQLETLAEDADIEVIIDSALHSLSIMKDNPALFSLQRPFSQGAKGAATITEMNIEDFELKPWRKPGADITDYFNYGFNEATWKRYCARYAQMSKQAGPQTQIQAVEAPLPPMVDYQNQQQPPNSFKNSQNFHGRYGRDRESERDWGRGRDGNAFTMGGTGGSGWGDRHARNQRQNVIATSDQYVLTPSGGGSGPDNDRRDGDRSNRDRGRDKGRYRVRDRDRDRDRDVERRNDRRDRESDRGKDRDDDRDKDRRRTRR